MISGRSRARRGSAAIAGVDAGDDGSILPLVIASCALGLAVILMGSAASSLYLERVRLFSLADAAALAGAESFDVDGDGGAALAGGDGGIALPPLTDAGVASTVTAFLADEPTAGIHDLQVDAARTPDGRSARVTLSATWIPPRWRPSSRPTACASPSRARPGACWWVRAPRRSDPREAGERVSG